MKMLPAVFVIGLLLNSCKKDVGVYFHNHSTYILNDFAVDGKHVGNLNPGSISTAFYFESVSYGGCGGDNFHLSAKVNGMDIQSRKIFCCGEHGQTKKSGLLLFDIYANDIGTDSGTLVSAFRK